MNVIEEMAAWPSAYDAETYARITGEGNERMARL